MAICIFIYPSSPIYIHVLQIDMVLEKWHFKYFIGLYKIYLLKNKKKAVKQTYEEY